MRPPTITLRPKSARRVAGAGSARRSAAARASRVAAATSAPRDQRGQALVLAPVGIFETDPDGRCTFVNERWCELAGITADEALGRGWARALHPEDRDRVVGSWQAAVAAGRELSIEFRMLRPDGSVRWVDGRARSLSMAGGPVTGYIGTLTDITAAVEANRQLGAERLFVDTVLEIAGSLICVFDPEGRFLRFNKACERVSGYTFEEIAGRPFYDFLIPAPEIAAVKTALGRLRAGEPPAPNENHWVTRDGSLRLISWANASFYDVDGALTHIVSTGIDITEQRRALEALRGIEAVGTLLAKTGPTDASLAELVRELSGRMNYAHVAVFLQNGDRLRLAAQLGYEGLPAEFDPGLGIVGRVYRTATPTLVDDVRSDPDYLPGDAEVTSEIAVPLVAEGQTLGVISIESTAAAPLGAADFRFAQMVAERLSVAIQLGEEQRMVSDRARLLAAVSAFARRANGVIDGPKLLPELLDAIGDVMTTDATALTLWDPATESYRIRAVRGAIDEAAVGAEIRTGEGSPGRAIAERRLVLDERDRDTYAPAVRDLLEPPAMFTASVPLIRDTTVLGAISVGRRQEAGAGFSAVEGEALGLLAAHAALALTNAQLVQEVRELAVRDTLTGLYNRRHFDAALELVFGRWRRGRGKRPLAAVFFDLDHFGLFNKKHGHQAGDTVLRAFAGILNERFRSADLVARYGGEEFVAILEETDLNGAVAVAEEVRAILAERPIIGPSGEILRATVSAGCAQLDPAEPTRDALLRTADVALFMAKRGGRNQVVAA